MGRLAFGAREDILPLCEIPYVKHKRARALHKCARVGPPRQSCAQPRRALLLPPTRPGGPGWVRARDFPGG